MAQMQSKDKGKQKLIVPSINVLRLENFLCNNTNTYTIPELKEFAKQRKLPVSGNKPLLVARLLVDLYLNSPDNLKSKKLSLYRLRRLLHERHLNLYAQRVQHLHELHNDEAKTRTPCSVK